MTITEELGELGHLGGRATMAMLRDRWRSALRPMVALTPPGGWDDEVQEDLLHEFLSHRLENLTDALISVGDDEDAVLKLTSRIMRNWLIDQARKTDTGRIRLRLEELLRSDPAFVQVAGPTRWALAGPSGAEIGRDDEGSLLQAAMAVSDVKQVRWRDAARRAPMASGPDLLRVLTGVLRRAGPGGAEIGMLTRVFQRRFSVAITSLVPLDANDSLPDRILGPAAVEPRDESWATARAREVYEQLSDRERRILLHLDDRAKVQRILDVGRSVAYSTIARVRTTLAALAGEDVNVEAVIAELVRLAGGDAASDDVQDATSEPPATTDAMGAQRP